MTHVKAFQMDGAGKAVEIDLPEGLATLPEDGFLWVHMRGQNDEILPWLARSGLDPLVVDALTAEETRPRCTVHEDGVLLNLRGVNLSPGSEPEDMVSIRLYMNERLVVSVQRRVLYAVRDVWSEIEGGAAAASPGELAARIALRLADRAEPVVAALNERIDDLEDKVIDGVSAPERGDLADVRRVSILLRRYMAPQRDALTTLELEEQEWLHGLGGHIRLREAAERVTRLAEELDAIRDRAQVVHDQIMDMRGEAMNRQMLVLSIVAAVFLPLGLITGLLGINVGGIPGSENPWAFWIVCAILVITVIGQMWLFRKMGLWGRD